MTRKVLIAHAPGEERFAELMAGPIRDAGYDVIHRGTIMVGESFNEEAFKVLNIGGAIVLCGTVRGVGTGWAYRLVHAARQYSDVRIFAVQMEQEAYLQPFSGDAAVALYWQDPAKAVADLTAALAKYYPSALPPDHVRHGHEAERRYRELALESCDIIDLANLPESDRHLVMRHLELRRLYVALRVRVEIRSDALVGEADLKEIEKRRASPWGMANDRPQLEETARIPVGTRLSAARKLILLGDPGAGKTTMIRWMATSYLLRLKHSHEWRDVPDVATLPDEDWLPIIIRCRDLGLECLQGTLDNILRYTLRRTELSNAEGDALLSLLKERLSQGRALLLLDGLDEIVDPVLRIRFCQQLEQIQIAYPHAPMVVTSRIVGYREIGYRIGRGFEHLTFADLSRQDKDDFARRWCAVTESPERRGAATRELIHDIHSADRIERLTGNPMLLTTLALVKRKIGSLPSRRADLYWDALEVLLNWRREVDEPIDHREAIPQLQYMAYAMCERGVLQLREDELLELLERMREEYPRIHLIRKHSAEEFLHLLERRTGILVEAGHVRHHGRPIPLFEFRHLTFQEYLAGLALVEGRFPGREHSRTLAENISRLAGQTVEIAVGDKSGGAEPEETETTVAENWREAIRLCVASCNDDDVEAVLQAVLTPLEGEDAQVTARPRAVQAALCLADDPNVSDGFARSLLQSFVRHVNEKDGLGPVKTSLDAAVKELSGSRWVVVLYDLLLDGFMEAEGESGRRHSFGSLCGMIAVVPVPEEEGSVRQKLTELSGLICWGDERTAAGAALQVMYLCYSREIYSHAQSLVDGLFALLGRSPAAAFAAAWALNWMNHDKADGKPWQPSASETEGLITFITNPHSDADAVRLLTYILERERVEGAVESLVFRLGDKGKGVRAAAAEALGWIGDTRAVEALSETADDKETSVRKAAITSLGQICDPRAVELLLNRLEEDEDDSVRQVAAWALGWIADERAVSPLIAKLEDGSGNVRQAAARALSRIGELRALPVLIEKLQTENDDDVRAAVAWSLSRFGDARAVGPLINALGDGGVKLRGAAAYALDKFKDGGAVAALVTALEDEDGGVRQAASYALGSIRDARASEPLITRLGDKDGNVRRAAIRSLGKLATVGAVEPLTVLLDEEDSNIRAEAVAALAEIGGASAVMPIVRKLGDENISVRKAAAEAAGRLGHVETAEQLSAKIDDENLDEKGMAELALAGLAWNRFKAGKAEGAAEIFGFILSKARADDYCEDYRNNIAYCLTLLGRYEEAAEQFEAMEFSRRHIGWPLYRHNLGVLSFLMGQVEEGRKHLKEALDWIRTAAATYNTYGASCMLILGHEGGVTSRDGLPVDAAILMNLHAMGGMTEADMRKELARRYRAAYENWLSYAETNAETFVPNPEGEERAGAG